MKIHKPHVRQEDQLCPTNSISRNAYYRQLHARYAYKSIFVSAPPPARVLSDTQFLSLSSLPFFPFSPPHFEIFIEICVKRIHAYTTVSERSRFTRPDREPSRRDRKLSVLIVPWHPPSLPPGSLHSLSLIEPIAIYSPSQRYYDPPDVRVWQQVTLCNIRHQRKQSYDRPYATSCVL